MISASILHPKAPKPLKMSLGFSRPSLTLGPHGGSKTVAGANTSIYALGLPLQIRGLSNASAVDGD